MLALRLTRVAHPAVQLRRLLVAAAAAGTGFLLLSALGYAMAHPAHSTAALLRLSWCAVPLAATVYLAVAVARTDPGTRPRPGLSALGLGPARLMAVAALNTVLACTLGSLLALAVFLHLRGDLTGMPFDGAAKDFLAADQPLPLPAALTLLTVPPVLASTAVALVLRPRDLPGTPARNPVYALFGARNTTGARHATGAHSTTGADATTGSRPTANTRLPGHPAPETAPSQHSADGDQPSRHPVGGRAAGAMGVPPRERSRAWGRAGADGALPAPVSEIPPTLAAADPAPTGLPWAVAVLAAGLATESYTGVTGASPRTALPGGLATGPVGLLVGWSLTALGLVLAAPALAHLCGRLLQAVRPGALRLLAGRGLMAEATRIGRPLGVVCAVTSAAFAATVLHGGDKHPGGPLTTLGGLVVAGCAVATLLTTAVEARQSRAATTEALLRLGAPATLLRGAAALRTGALLAFFGPFTLLIADLAARPLVR
ncbi:hypothetical protein ABZ646_02495 [Streptomyces sp. NPDC007162]|uniref:hypothetical protein n=1 Tax=Streptomyces sp. NPDC007162 TaxID=3156917 RepID=UPI0033C7CA6D